MRISKKVFEQVWRQVNAGFAKLDWRVLQTAESMCGTTFWKSQKFGKQLAMGRCVKYFANPDNDVLPIEVANPGKKGKRKYRRK